MAFLEVYFPDGRVEHFELNKNTMNIGRSSQADISIELPAISRIHARIEKNAQNRWQVTDLDSRNKTYVNNKSIKTHVLTNHDIFFFGSIKVVFQDPSGDSDEKSDQTVPRAKKGGKNICPLCKADMAEHAVVCISCGYNIKLGKRMKLQVDSDANGKNSDTHHTPFAIDAKIPKEKPEKKVDNDPPPPKSRWLLIVIALLLIVAAVGGYFFLIRTH